MNKGKTLFDCAELLSRGECSSLELTNEYLGRIEEKDPRINAYITVCRDTAEALAKASDERRARGETLSSLDGVPFSVKDNFCVEGIRCTCGSAFLENYIPPYTSTAVQKLLSLGGVLLGKTNMDEFAMGSLCESSYFGACKNPLNASLPAGGSSGGSAASVSADMAVFSLGSDTGGSVRLPADLCGTVGLKPTYGRISRYGLVAFASSLDTVGVLAKTVDDAALLLSCLSGKDCMDATSLSNPPFEENAFSVSGAKIGIIREFYDISDEKIKARLDSAARGLSDRGGEVFEISIPSLKLSAECYYIISSCEAASNLARFDGIRYGSSSDARSLSKLYVKNRSLFFGDEVKRRIMLGNFALSEGAYDDFYGKAQVLRTSISKEMERIFEKCDLLLSPTSLFSPDTLSRGMSRTELYSNDAAACFANLAGIPALNIPFSGCGGVQLSADRLCEYKLFAVGKCLGGEI